MMRAVTSRNNRSTEMLFRMALVRSRVVGWRTKNRGILGNPDFSFPRLKLLVFVDGCFWHGCPRCGHFPKTNARFWQVKLLGNRKRDFRITRALRSSGFRVIRMWEHELRNPVVI